jgi:hypothetical protein
MTTLGGENADLFSFTACGKISNDNFESSMFKKVPCSYESSVGNVSTYVA